MKQYNSANFATGGLGRLCKPSNLVPGVKLLNIGSFQFFSHMNSLNTPNTTLILTVCTIFKIFEKMQAIMLYWFAALQRTSTFRHQKFGLF